MKICLLVEGSYPYVVGGVASWIQLLINGMPEHEFIVCSIGAEEKYRGKFKYKIPSNVSRIQEIFLDSIFQLKASVSKQYRLPEHEKEVLRRLIAGGREIELENLLAIFRASEKRKDPMGIFTNFEFFDVITDVYRDRFSHLPFTDFFWTVRSMVLPLFYLLQQDLPDADVYHSVAAGYCGIIGGMAASVSKKPFILTEHGIYAREREEEIIKSSWAKGQFKGVWIQYFYNLSRLAYDKAHKVISLFGRNAEVEAALGCDPQKIGIIPNGIRIEQYGQVPPLEDKKGAITIGAIVRVVPIKDIITMIRCFAMVQRALPYAKFRLVGGYDEDPEYYEECRNLVETLQIRELEFCGICDVKEKLAEVDMVILSSISEAQPLVILEAFAARRPVVATDVGCCRELLFGEAGDSFGAAGRIVPVMDFEGMAKEIIELAANYRLRKEMGEAGQKRVCAYYTFDAFINAYRDLYRAQHEKIVPQERQKAG
jgi:glycosyltransferase involved in cell wall biosynthesis